MSLGKQFPKDFFIEQASILMKFFIGWIYVYTSMRVNRVWLKQ